MRRNSPPIRLFPSFEEAWASLDGVNELMEAAELRIARRVRGNQRIPRWTERRKPKLFAPALAALGEWANGLLLGLQ